MRSIIIMAYDGYRLTSHGNGWAYTLADTINRRSVFLQDDDATLFRADIEAREAANPHASPLPDLWSEYAHLAREH
jgi:hypothetical protein